MKTLQILQKNKKRLILPIVMDFVFFFAAVAVFYVFYNAMVPSLLAVSEIASNELGAALQSMTIENADALDAVMPKMQEYYSIIMANMFYMVICFFAVYLAAQSVSWHRLHILFKKIAFWDYAKPFALISAAYFLVFLVSAPLIYTFLYFISNIAGTPVRPAYAFMVTVIFLIISYLAVTAYSMIGEKGIFKASFKKAVSAYFLRFGAAAAGIFIIGLMLVKMITLITNPIIQFILVLVIIPFITIAKLWMLE